MCNCLIIVGLVFSVGTYWILGMEFQMICHCGVCVSSTKTLDWILEFVFDLNVYLFPILEFCMHLCKHVCCFSPYAFPSAWLLTTGLVNELEYETGLMLYENVYDSRVCGRVSSRQEWWGLKVCNEHTQAICDQVQQWPGNLHLCLQAQQASEQLVFVLLFLPYGKVLSGASIWLVVGAQLTIRSGFWNWLIVGHRPSRPSTEGISEVFTFTVFFFTSDYSSQLDTRKSSAHQSGETFGAYICCWVGWDQYHFCQALWCLLGLSILWASGQPICLMYLNPETLKDGPLVRNLTYAYQVTHICSYVFVCLFSWISSWLQRRICLLYSEVCAKIHVFWCWSTCWLHRSTGSQYSTHLWWSYSSLGLYQWFSCGLFAMTMPSMLVRKMTWKRW